MLQKPRGVRCINKRPYFGTRGDDHRISLNRVENGVQLTPSQETVGQGFFGHAVFPRYSDRLRLPHIEICLFPPLGNSSPGQRGPAILMGVSPSTSRGHYHERFPIAETRTPLSVNPARSFHNPRRTGRAQGEILTKGRLSRTFEGWMGIEIVISLNWNTSGGQAGKRSEL